MTEELRQKIVGAFEKSFSVSNILSFGKGAKSSADEVLSLEGHEKDCVRNYTSNAFFIEINKFMYNREFFYESDFTIKDVIGNIYGLAKSMSPLETERVVFRGTSDKYFEGISNAIEGEKLSLRAFTSATANPSIADYYAKFMRGRMIDETTPVVFKIHVPSGTPCYECKEEDTKFVEESELILPPANYTVNYVGIRAWGSRKVLFIGMDLIEPLDIKSIVLDGIDFTKRNLKSPYNMHNKLTSKYLSGLEQTVRTADFPSFTQNLVKE